MNRIVKKKRNYAQSPSSSTCFQATPYYGVATDSSLYPLHPSKVIFTISKFWLASLITMSQASGSLFLCQVRPALSPSRCV